MTAEETFKARIVAELHIRQAYAHLRGGFVAIDQLAIDQLAIDLNPAAPGTMESLIREVALDDDSPVEFYNPPDRSAVQLPSDGRAAARAWIEQHDPDELPFGMR